MSSDRNLIPRQSDILKAGLFQLIHKSALETFYYAKITLIASNGSTLLPGGGGAELKGIFGVEVYRRGVQTLTLSKTKIVHFASLFKTRNIMEL